MRTNIALFFTGILVSLFSYFYLPEKVPLHFNIYGKADRWGSKSEFLILNGLALLLILGLYFLIPRIDPKRKGLWDSRGYHRIFSVVLLFFILFPLFPYLYLKGFSESFLVNLLVGIVFILLGNYLPTIKPNYFVGIRTPWTLESEVVWRKTHRTGGWAFIIAGLLLIFSIFLPRSWTVVSLLVLALVLAVFIIIYSYIVWVKLPKG